MPRYRMGLAAARISATTPPSKRLRAVWPRQTSSGGATTASSTDGSTSATETSAADPSTDSKRQTSATDSSTSDPNATASINLLTSQISSDVNSQVSSSSSSTTSDTTSSSSSSSTSDSTSTATSTSTSTATSTSPSSTSSSSSTTTSSSSSSTTTITTTSSSSDTTSTSTTTSSSSDTSTTTTSSQTTDTSTAGTSTTASYTVETVNGSQVTSYYSSPTILGSDDSGGSTSSSQKKAIIAGTVIGGVILLMLLAGLGLFYRRHQHKKISFFKRRAPKPRSQLLAGEDIDDEHTPMQRYRDQPFAPNNPGMVQVAPQGMGGSRRPSIDRASGSSPPSIMRPRADTGSIFHEAVWPPPGTSSRFIDPLTAASSRVDLGGIVDDVMGPPPLRGGGYGSVGGSSQSRSQESFWSREGSSPPGHVRNESTSSTTGLLSASGPGGMVHGHSPLASVNPPPPDWSNRSSVGSLEVEGGGSVGKKTVNWLDRSPKKTSAQTLPDHQEGGVGQAI